MYIYGQNDVIYGQNLMVMMIQHNIPCINDIDNIKLNINLNIMLLIVIHGSGNLFDVCLSEFNVKIFIGSIF